MKRYTDKQRLDWLVGTNPKSRHFKWDRFQDVYWSSSAKTTPRQAIDAAMRREKGEAKP